MPSQVPVNPAESARSLSIEVAQFLDRLDQTHAQLAALYEKKSSALRKAETAAILQLSEQEVELSRQLQQRLIERRDLIQRAQTQGFAVRTLEQLLPHLPVEVQAALQKRVDRSKQRVARMRHEVWVHWIVAQRSYSQCSRVLDLIATKGEKSPVYSAGSSRETSGGGALLDASA